MAAPILPTAVVVDHIQLADATGIPIPVPRATVRTWLSQGLSRATLTIPLEGLTLTDLDATAAAAGPSVAATGPALSMIDAARRLKASVDKLSLAGQEMSENAARVRVRRACDHGDVLAYGSGRSRRVDPASLHAWVQNQTRQLLDEIDANRS